MCERGMRHVMVIMRQGDSGDVLAVHDLCFDLVAKDCLRLVCSDPDDFSLGLVLLPTPSLCALANLATLSQRGSTCARVSSRQASQIQGGWSRKVVKSAEC